MSSPSRTYVAILRTLRPGVTERKPGDAVLDPKERVEQLERQIAELRQDVRGDLRDLKTGLEQVNGHIADVLMELGTVPDRRYREPDRLTVTRRLHKLENDSASARIAGAALASAEASKAQAWTRWQKIALFIIAVVGMILGILAAIGITN